MPPHAPKGTNVSRHQYRLATRYVLASGAWLAIATAVVALLSPALQSPGSFIVGGAALLVGVYLAVLYWRANHYELTRSHNGGFESRRSDDVSPSSIDRLFDPRGRGQLTLNAARVFATGVLDPREVFDRITESAEPWHRVKSLEVV